MAFEKIRRISTALMALVLAIGLTTHGLGSADLAGKSAMTVANDMPMSGDMPMQGKCDGCAGDEKGVAPVCFACCGAVIALPAMAVVLYAVPGETLSPTAGQIVIGRAEPPDPYPPRPIIVS